LDDGGATTAYFQREWVDSDFKFWGSGNTPPGYATSANPIEQFNAIVKKYTFRKKHGIAALIHIFAKLAKDQSTRGVSKKEFVTRAKVPTKTMRRAKALVALNALYFSEETARTCRAHQVSIYLLPGTVDADAEEIFEGSVTDLKGIVASTIRYYARNSEMDGIQDEGENGEDGYWVVDLDAEDKCNCRFYLKWQYCVHYVAFAIRKDEPYPGQSQKATLLMDRRHQAAITAQANLAARGRGSGRGRGRARARARGSARGATRGSRANDGRGGGRPRRVGTALSLE